MAQSHHEKPLQRDKIQNKSQSELQGTLQEGRPLLRVFGARFFVATPSQSF